MSVYYDAWGSLGIDLEAPLVRAVLDAHATAARDNQNVSRVACEIAKAGSGDLVKGVIAALATLGQAHGPIAQAREVIFRGDPAALLDDGERVPGWGNSFFRDRVDPAWHRVEQLIRADHPAEATDLDEITSLLHKRGKRIWPNAAAFTAVAAEVSGMPPGTEAALFIAGRLPVWAGL